MRLKLVESVEQVLEKFTSIRNATNHLNNHMAKSYSDFFDYVLSSTLNFETHLDLVPPMELDYYIRVADALQLTD